MVMKILLVEIVLILVVVVVIVVVTATIVIITIIIQFTAEHKTIVNSTGSVCVTNRTLI
jgi:hypothetical protein